MFEGFIALDELGRGPRKKELAYFQGPLPQFIQCYETKISRTVGFG